jgi:methylmalonyl-CoA mutase, N-terminal domain
VESLTDELERQAYAYFARIDELGCMVDAVKQNFPQREIADASFEQQIETDSGRRWVVGVNAYRHEDDGKIPTLRIDPALEGKQIERVRAVRARRDGAVVEAELARLREAAAREDENLMPHLLDAARAHCTEGEIVGALRDVWGDYRETPVF